MNSPQAKSINDSPYIASHISVSDTMIHPHNMKDDDKSPGLKNKRAIATLIPVPTNLNKVNSGQVICKRTKIQTSQTSLVHINPSVIPKTLDVLCHIPLKNSNQWIGNQRYREGLNHCLGGYLEIDTVREKQMYCSRLRNTFDVLGVRFLTLEQRGINQWKSLMPMEMMKKIETDLNDLSAVSENNSGLERKKYRKNAIAQSQYGKPDSSTLKSVKKPHNTQQRTVISRLLDDVVCHEHGFESGAQEDILGEENLFRDPVFPDLESDLQLNLDEFYRSLESGEMKS